MIEYLMYAKCDKCGALIEPAVEVIKSRIDRQRWEWERRWAQTGVMYGLPNRYGKRKLYCAQCADLHKPNQTPEKTPP